MLVLSNLTATSTFSLRLQAKLVDANLPLYLVLTRQADLAVYEYLLVNESIDINYYTFTIDASNLYVGDYDVKIYNGDYIPGEENQDCLIDVAIEVEEPTMYTCDPLTVETLIDLKSTMQVQSPGTPAALIYTEKGKVEGNEINTFFINQAQPTYHVYEG